MNLLKMGMVCVVRAHMHVRTCSCVDACLLICSGSQVTANYKDDTIGNVIPKHETSNEAASNLLDVNRNERASISSSVQPSSDPAISSSIQTPSSRLVGNEWQPKNVWTIFRADQISSSISASENIRLLCSAAIALLAVLSFVFPLWRSIFGRPLFLVLLTDVTIVLGLILIKEGGSSKAKAESRRAGIYGEDWSYKIGKALEVGLVLHKAISAAVIDCSVCVVLLISVLSLLRLG